MNARPRLPAKPQTSRARPKATASLYAIVEHLDKTLRTSEISDRSVNGLQVDGAAEITKIGLAVDASLEAFKLAAEKGCQMLIVHHGMIWEGLKRITGPVYRQIEFLVKNGISLYASHLPLDMHPTLGNNARIARALGLRNLRPFGVYHGSHIGFEGDLPRAATVKSVSETVRKLYGGPVTSLPFGPQKIRRVAVISGNGSSALPEAVERRVDLFVTGESSHENHHAALEGKLNVVYGGHYHTEKPGVQAVGELLKKKFGIEAAFLDVPTLV